MDIIDDMRKLRDNSSDDPRVVIAAEKCLESVNRHSKFLHPQLVPMAIGSDKVTIGEKRAIAKALIAVKDDFDIRKVDTDYTKFDLARKFVTKDSWLMFHLLDLLDDPDKTEWLNQEQEITYM